MWQIVVFTVANHFGYFIWSIHFEVVKVWSRLAVKDFVLALSNHVLSKKGVNWILMLTFCMHGFVVMRILGKDEWVAIQSFVGLYVFHIGSPGYVWKGTKASPMATLNKDQCAFRFCWVLKQFSKVFWRVVIVVGTVQQIFFNSPLLGQ